ncbi:U-scoloptoxin(01)-Cw1a-like [Panulirus ornatus]|uniref:U-scoloptoxin(01)-Cw1a-like n=1 Tax=Panulirus ornatus TaxID=150431 RepID=UPI003A83E344
MQRLVALLLTVAAVALAQFAWEFPVDYENTLTSPLVTSFTCEGRNYGYYADVDNNCEVYHVCLPVTDTSRNVIYTAHYSFICNNETIFSQNTLSCDTRDRAYPCEQAPSLFDFANRRFSYIPVEDTDSDDDPLFT